ncbi:MAG: TPM domain-containing protein [Bacteroidota bacterium]
MSTLTRFSSALSLVVLTVTGLEGAEVPFLSGRVNDYAGILSAESTAHLNELLKAHEDSTSNQVVILTIPSLEGEDLESFSIRVVDQWKLGQKGKDNGVLLLVSRDDRKVRIEVGRGLEGDLPDITCGLIIRREIIPRFKEGDYDAGVAGGVTAILAAIRGSYSASEEESGGEGDIVFSLLAGGIFIVVVGLFTMIGLLTRGGASWFLYVFLLPFWIAFPSAILGVVPGVTAFGLYAVGFPLMKLWLARSNRGKEFVHMLASKKIFSTAGSGGGWSSGSSGWSSSSGGSFSGGGGGFSGGGASGSW